MSEKEGADGSDYPAIHRPDQREPYSQSVSFGSVLGSNRRSEPHPRDSQALGTFDESIVDAEPIVIAEPADHHAIGALQLTSTQLSVGPIPAPWVLKEYDALVPWYGSENYYSKLYENPQFTRFARDYGLSYTDPVIELRELWLNRLGSKENPTIALVGANGFTTLRKAAVVAVQEAFAKAGLHMVFGEIPEIRWDHGKPVLGGEQIDIILRFFTVDDLWQDNELLELATPIFNAQSTGNVLVWTSLHSSLFSNKFVMGLLSSNTFQNEFSAEEHALVNNLLPWTRSLTNSTITINGAETGLKDHVIEKASELILKPTTGAGGQGIIAGWECSSQEWEKAVAERIDTGYIVQKRVHPRVELAADKTGHIRDWATTWGVFYTARGYGGAMARALPAYEDTILQLGNPRTRVAGVFTYLENLLETSNA